MTQSFWAIDGQAWTPAAGMALAVAAAASGGLMLWLSRVRRSPAEKERRRRMMVNRRGRIVAGVVTDAEQDTLYYTYKLRGVEYLASQDVSALRDMLPPNLGFLVGAVSVKYLTENPANSIAVCEQWSGLRKPDTAPAEKAFRASG